MSIVGGRQHTRVEMERVCDRGDLGRRRAERGQMIINDEDIFFFFIRHLLRGIGIHMSYCCLNKLKDLASIRNSI